MIPYAPRERFTQPNRLSDLILRSGDAQADAHLRSGQIWGNTIGKLGNIASGYVEDRAEQKQEQAQAAELSRRDQAALAVMSNPDADPLEFVRIYGPREGIKVAQGFEAFKKIGAGASQSPEDLFKLYGGVNALSPALRAKAYPTLAANVSKAIPALAGALPAEYSDESWKEIGSLLGGMNPAKPGEGFTLSENQVRIGPDGKEIARGPVSAPKPPNLQTVETIQGIQTFNPQTGEMGPVVAQPKRHPPKDKATMTPTMEANVVNRLTTQWGTATKTVKELKNQISLMDAGLNAARNGDLAQGAQAVLVTFQKILDPTSVVRESEYMRSAAGQAVLDRMAGYVEQLQKGGAGVPLSQLEKFADVAREAAKAQAQSLPSQKKRIGAIADRYQIPQELIFEDTDYSDFSAPKAASPVIAPVKPQSKGKLVQDANGVWKRVP